MKLLNTHILSLTAREHSQMVSHLGSIESNDSKQAGFGNAIGYTVCSGMERHAQIDTLSHSDAVDTLLGLAKLRVHWSQLRDMPTFLEQLVTLVPRMTSKSVTDVVWALGTSQARWVQLTPSLRNVLLDAVGQHVDKMNAYALSSVLWSLAKMGAKWTQLSQDIKEGLPVALDARSESMSPQQSSKVVWALGSLGASPTILSEYSLSALVSNVNSIKRSQMGSAVSGSQMLTGIAKLGIQWSGLSTEMRNSLWEELTRVCGSTNDRGIANAVWAMGTMGAKHRDSPPPVFDVLMRGCARAARTCSSWSLSNIVWGLAKMGLSWSDVGDEMRQAIMLNVARVEEEMNAVDVSVLLWSLGNMEAPLYSLPDYFMEPLLRGVLRNLGTMSSSELSRLIWGLSGCGVSWDMLPAGVRWNINVALRRVGDALSPQDIANCAYGLALLAFDADNPSDAAFRGAHEVLLSAVRRASLALSGCPKELEQLRIFSQYVGSRKQLVADLKAQNQHRGKTSGSGGTGKDSGGTASDQRMPDEILTSGELGDLPWARTSSSNLQESVISALQEGLLETADREMHLRVVSEVSSFDGVYPCDAMVFQAGKVVAMLEIDGPQHYRDDGGLRRKDQLKESMYTRRHPHAIFLRVRWDEVYKVGADNVGAELAREICDVTEKSRSTPMDPLGGIGTLFRNLLS